MIKYLMALVAGVLLAAPAWGYINSDDVIRTLFDGNKRFVKGKLTPRATEVSLRQVLARAHYPFATILTCSDARVPPELIFDQGMGDLYVVRSAGPVLDRASLGSVEHGAVHLGTPVLVLLGHTNCEVIAAATKKTTKPQSRNYEVIINDIRQALPKAKKSAKAHHTNLEDETNREHIRLIYKDIVKRSPAIQKRRAQNQLKIVLATYSLDTGRVNVITIR